MKAINANIDEITKLQNQMMKKAAEHRQQVRNLLTDEQKLWFDSHVGGGKGKMGAAGRGRPGDGEGNGRPGSGFSLDQEQPMFYELPPPVFPDKDYGDEVTR